MMVAAIVQLVDIPLAPEPLLRGGSLRRTNDPRTGSAKNNNVAFLLPLRLLGPRSVTHPPLISAQAKKCGILHRSRAIMSSLFCVSPPRFTTLARRAAVYSTASDTAFWSATPAPSSKLNSPLLKS